MQQPRIRRRALAWNALVVAGAMAMASCSGRVDALSVGAGSGAVDERPAIPAREDGTVGAVGTMLNALVMEPELVDPAGVAWADSVPPEVSRALFREVMASGGAVWPVLQRSTFVTDVGSSGSLGLTAVALDAIARGEAALGREPGCQDVAEWVAAKHRWQLAVDRIELQTLVEWFEGCIDDPAPGTQIG